MTALPTAASRVLPSATPHLADRRAWRLCLSQRADQGVDDDETVVSRSGTVSTVDTVNGFEVFLVLSLFCSGNVDDQLALVFGLFDLDQSHEMDPVRATVASPCRRTPPR